jgi:hypothetical protein
MPQNACKIGPVAPALAAHQVAKKGRDFYEAAVVKSKVAFSS